MTRKLVLRIICSFVSLVFDALSIISVALSILTMFTSIAVFNQHSYNEAIYYILFSIATGIFFFIWNALSKQVYKLVKDIELK